MSAATQLGIETWRGQQVLRFTPDGISNLHGSAFRIEAPGKQGNVTRTLKLLRSILDTEHAASTQALFIRPKSNADKIFETLIERRDRLPDLRAVYLEEAYGGGSKNADVVALLEAYPEMEELSVKGGSHVNRSARNQRHMSLRSLSLLPAPDDVEASSDVTSMLRFAAFPHLEELEVGNCDFSEYGQYERQDFLLFIFLNEALFPKLKRLCLTRFVNAAYLAHLAAESPVVAGLKELELHACWLGDSEANIFLNAPSIRKLERLTINYHMFSEPMVRQLQTLPLDVTFKGHLDWDPDYPQLVDD